MLPEPATRRTSYHLPLIQTLLRCLLSLLLCGLIWTTSLRLYARVWVNRQERMVATWTFLSVVGLVSFVVGWEESGSSGAGEGDSVRIENVSDAGRPGLE
jgi:hypothetical protein